MAIPGLYVALALLPVFLGLLQPLHSGEIFLFGPANDGFSPRILLLTAHPDDETFFFGPTLTSLIPSSGVSLSPNPESPIHPNSVPFTHPQVYSLCFSVGNADGLGYIRRRELRDSLDVIGVAEDKRWVLDKNEFQDNITARWNASLIAATVYDFISDHDISIILTFDSYGVSGHPNHCSLYHGVSELLAMSPASFKYPLAAYSLASKSVVTKYIGILAPILVKPKMTFFRVLESTVRDTEDGSPDLPVRPIFVAGIGGYYRAVLATLQHRSQRTWFRWLYMVFSQYLWVNEWERIHATVDVETL
ncbi:LmbE-like protein [Lactarius psammicola]|nr:LmbE-like protein [Lactarius psammicola]